jgi:hypothetical protein
VTADCSALATARLLGANPRTPAHVAIEQAGHR